jgi:hypothetical protein
MSGKKADRLGGNLLVNSQSVHILAPRVAFAGTNS